ncbi:MAG: type II toxin-antitoxin system RelE/ParE family toxin [Gemmatimonadetes bacterium]|nr:type II toxin-antitoxin system RelE/ParE family toxin [Gemmatimonadota bacterium]
MNPTWRVVYYESKDGRCEIWEFIEARGKRDQAKLPSWIGLLADYGPHLLRPYADLLEDGIHGLRVTLSGDQVRCLYFFCLRNLIVLTHAFVKTTGRVPRTEIRKALKSRDDFLNRVDARQ